MAVRGNGAPGDFAGLDLHGKVAIIARGTIPFSDKAKNAAEAGALAVVIYNNEQGSFNGTLRDRVGIPTLAVSGKDGRALLDLLSKGPVKVRIESDTLLAQKNGHNIIGTLKGTTDDILVLGGHYDSVQAGPGANDNGSGTAVLMELARALAPQAHKYTLVFIAFDGEEFGLLGSRYYVEHLTAAERGKLKGMLNFDMLGGGSGPLLAGGDGKLGTLTRDVAGQMGINARNFALGGNAGSDHEPFQSAGIDTVFFSRDYSLLHTPQDSIDQVKEEYLLEAGKVALQVVITMDEKKEQ
jgi:aminopeptidase YwaD